MTRPLRAAVPNRHVTGVVLELLAEAGWAWPAVQPRQLSFVTADGSLQVCLVKTHDIPGKVAEGIFDLGFVQASVVAEEGGASRVVRELPLALGRMVVGVGENSPVESAADLAGKRIATRNPRLAARFLAERGLDCELLVVGGSPEAYVAAGAAAAALAYWKTGATFRANGLRVLDEVCRSALVLIAPEDAAAAGCEPVLARIDRAVNGNPIPEHWRKA